MVICEFVDIVQPVGISERFRFVTANYATSSY